MKQFFSIFFILACTWGIHIHSQAQSTTTITLKVIDQTKGKYTSDTQKVFSWIAMWEPSYVEYKNSGSWYSNFFDGFTGGKWTKTDTEWTWSYSFNVPNGGKFSWNPNIGTPGGTATEITTRYNLRQPGKPNIDFFVSATGTISGEVTVLFTDTYVALLDPNGNITRKETFNFDIPVKIIDKTNGTAIKDPVIGQLLNLTTPSQIISNNNDSWVHFSSEYASGKIQKNTHEWIYSYSLNATPGNQYQWKPATGSPVSPVYLLEKFGIGETSLFSINEGKVISGQTILVILNDNEARLIKADEEIDYLGDLTDHSGNDFLHAHGRWIVDEDGNRVLLRGIGLGNYMLLEPYMWGINNTQAKKSDTQQVILSSLAALTGWDNVNTFMDEYRKNYMTEADIQMLKENGFNSIRLPMHYNLFIEKEAANNNFIEKGFSMTDKLLEWCKKHEIYLILDMHAVPGGQSTDKAISDQYAPALWDGDDKGTAAQYQTKLISLWKEIARRYAGEKWIAGYDLINEIQYYPSGRDLSLEIRSLYQRITTAIREVDKKHILYIEGNGYANDHQNLTPVWDDNLVYSFHRYWCGNNQSSIQYMLDLRNSHKVPVWMGESGENSNTWFTDAVELLENNGIGWAWWAYKKVSNISGIVSVPQPEGWNKILSYLQSGTDNSASLGLNAATTRDILMALAENTQLEKAKINRDVIYAMIAQPYNNETQPYGNNNLPGKLYANEYDLGRNGYAYNETGILSRESQSAGAYNNGWTGRNDAVDLETCTDKEGNGFNIGWTDSGEWLNYTVNAPQSGKYKVSISYAVSGTGNLTLNVNGKAALSNITLPNTTAWNLFKRMDLGEIELQAGTSTIQVYIQSGFNYSYLQLDYDGGTGFNNVSLSPVWSFDGIYPNPVQDRASFAYYLPEKADLVRFQVYSMDGRLVDQIVSNQSTAGSNHWQYDATGLSRGVYQVILEIDNHGMNIYRKGLRMLVK